MANKFIECSTINISYNIMGIATINYSIVSDGPDFSMSNHIAIGDKEFSGIITNAHMQPIPGTDKSSSGGWYTISVTMIATT